MDKPRGESTPGLRDDYEVEGWCNPSHSFVVAPVGERKGYPCGTYRTLQMARSYAAILGAARKVEVLPIKGRIAVEDVLFASQSAIDAAIDKATP